MFNKLKDPEVSRIIIVVSLVIIALSTLLCGVNSLRKYDYAVMFSENAVLTLQQIKKDGWEIINARWAMDGRGAWNYEFIVRKHAPIFPQKQQAQPQQQPAPQAAPAAPKAEKPAEAPKAEKPAQQPAPAPAQAPAEAPKQ